MWATMGGDGSVMMGFSYDGSQAVELVLDEELGALRPPAVITTESVGRSKISFHASGQFKLVAEIGKSLDAVDRATVNGPRLVDIVEPRRMVELLLPSKLPLFTDQPADCDIVLDGTSSPDRPLRCSISCVGADRFEQLLVAGTKWGGTSIWEAVQALKNNTHVWVWTLRVSQKDVVYPDSIHLFLEGPVKWGRPAISQRLLPRTRGSRSLG
jgi:hypothetical protein